MLNALSPLARSSRAGLLFSARARGIATGRGGRSQQQHKQQQSRNAPLDRYETPVPVAKNVLLAGSLLGFVTGVYFFTTQRLQSVRFIGCLLLLF